MTEPFQNYHDRRRRIIQHSAKSLLEALLSDRENTPNNLDYLAEVLIDRAQTLLNEHGLMHCYPGHPDGDTPCYKSDTCQSECPYILDYKFEQVQKRS